MGKQKEEEEVIEMPPWHAMTKEDVVSELGLGEDLKKNGLTSSDAQARLEKYGENKLSEKEKVTLLQRIWHQIANVLVGILVVVAVVSAIRAATADDSDTVTTNAIQVGIILMVIT